MKASLGQCLLADGALSLELKPSMTFGYGERTCAGQTPSLS